MISLVKCFNFSSFAAHGCCTAEPPAQRGRQQIEKTLPCAGGSDVSIAKNGYEK